MPATRARLPRRKSTARLPKEQAETKEKPIWEVLAEMGREIPEEEWQKLPNDASINLEHYLYGAPKVES